jgi:hypothetical protein
MKAQHQANISADAGIRGGCRHCGRRMSLRQRLIGSKFCSTDHEEKARRSHVDLINRRLEESDITRDLRLCEAFQCHAPRTADGNMPEFRKDLEFCRRETLMIPGLDKLAQSMRLARSFGDEILVEPAPCPPAKAHLVNAACEPRLAMPAFTLGLASDARLRTTRNTVPACRSAAA